jgi:hypothetical protein
MFTLSAALTLMSPSPLANIAPSFENGPFVTSDTEPSPVPTLPELLIELALKLIAPLDKLADGEIFISPLFVTSIAPPSVLAKKDPVVISELKLTI